MPKRINHTIELKDAQYYYLKNLYNDIEFIEAIERVKATLKNKHGRDVSLLFDANYTLDQEDRGRIEELQRLFTVDNWSLAWFADGQYSNTGYIKPFSPVIVAEDDRLMLEITPDMKFEHLRLLWKWIELAQKKLPSYKGKTKAPAYPDLIYAVHKERRYGATFRRVFELYLKGELPGWEGKATQFKDQESLERYYQRYKPGT